MKFDVKMKTVVSKFIALQAVWMLLTVSVSAQDMVIYDIISTTGTIIDNSSGRELQIGDRISFQTMLQFGSPHDRAVLLSPEKSRYFLGLPTQNVISSELTVASGLALTPVTARPALIAGVRGGSTLTTNGVSQNTLREYFAVDSFTVVGNVFRLPVTRNDAEKFELLLRYETENGVKEHILTDFTINKDDLLTQGDKISECFVLLKEGNAITHVTQTSIFFVEKEQLFREFDSLLNAISQNRNERNAVREILRQYCTDVYGIIDRTVLEATINEFLNVN